MPAAASVVATGLGPAAALAALIRMSATTRES